MSAVGSPPGGGGLPMDAPKPTGEVGGVVVPYAGTDVLHALVGLDQQPSRLRHAPLGDPLYHGAARALLNHGGEVAG